MLMPGRNNEVFSRLIGFLIGLFCLENQIEFEPTGSMTQDDNNCMKIAKSDLQELATLDIDLLTHCVLMAQNSRPTAAQEFRKAIKLNS